MPLSGDPRGAPTKSETACAEFARSLFNGAAVNYDLWAQVLSYGQYYRWHRALVSSLTIHPGALVLDLATGTGRVGRAVRRRYGCRVVGFDVSPGMLALAKARNVSPRERLDLLQGTADHLPFPDAMFDAVTFTFLMRYVPDPLATLKEMARVMKPGGMAASLEFSVPRGVAWRWLWYVHTGAVLPLATLPLGRGWSRVGAFLGGSIREYQRRFPMRELEKVWSEAGFAQVESKSLSLGGAVVMVGSRK